MTTRLVEQLQRQNLLPAIDFIFSRAGCDAAVQQCLSANLRLTDAAERDEVISYVGEHLGGLSSEDLQLLHTIGDLLSMAVERARLYAIDRRMTRRDRSPQTITRYRVLRRSVSAAVVTFGVLSALLVESRVLLAFYPGNDTPG